MLEIVGLSKHFGDVRAVNGLDLTINPGEIFTMLGANGAGKTTPLMVSLGVTEPTSGLDPKSGAQFLQLLAELRAENKAIWMTTHDIFRAKAVADRVGIMSEGSLVKILTREELEEADLEKIYIDYVSRPANQVA
jgi:ABC-type multidrug transport system ATPase subunit